jgi:oligopeptidase B
MQNPIARKNHHIVKIGKVDNENRGENPMDPPYEVEDPYFWLRDDTRSNSDVLEWLNTENKYFKDKYEVMVPLSEDIYDEHLSHLKEKDISAPLSYGPYVYYKRTYPGLSYKFYCRMKKLKDNMTLDDINNNKDKEEIIMNVNKLAKKHNYCEVGGFNPSISHNIIAYPVDFTSDELYDIRLMTNIGDQNQDQEYFEHLTGDLSDDLEWKDDTHLFYISKDKTKRCNRIWCHILGTSQENDFIIFEDDDELFNVGIYTLLHENYLVITSSSSETSICYLLDLNKFSDEQSLKESLLLVRSKEEGIRYSIEGIRDNGKEVFILTNNDDCINNKIIMTDINNLDKWDNVVVGHSDEKYIDDIEVFRDFSVISGREKGLTQVWAIDKYNNNYKRIPTPEDIYEISVSSNADYNANDVLIEYSSLKTPSTWFKYNPETDERTIIKQMEILEYNPDEYICDRLYATAPDNTEIAISLIRSKNLDTNKPQPTVLEGYGSYGICNDPEFDRRILPYITRGVIYCVAHIRGGEENGRDWYEVEGKLLTKRNTFQDFISCAEELIDSGVTTPSQLAICGRSAGGLLMGAVVNMRPDLFKAVVAGVPFVDLMVTMSDPSIPLTTEEWEEWGNPNERKYFDYMMSYCPMTNVRKQPYPHMLITAGLHDPRVPYWEPVKWTSKLREHKTNDNDVLLKVDMETGHFSASDRYRYLRETSVDQAFILHHIKN